MKDPEPIARAREIVDRLTNEPISTIVADLAETPLPANPHAYMVGVLMGRMKNVLEFYDNQGRRTPSELPGCHVYRCDHDAPFLDVNGFPVCLDHAPRYSSRGVA